MDSSFFRDRIERILHDLDVRVNGERPWDLQVHTDRFYRKVALFGSLGLGESYMDGWWDCRRVDILAERLLRAELDRKVKGFHDYLDWVRGLLCNLQRPSRAFEIGRRHYDAGNRLYQCMLDQRMIYSCGYWKEAATLDEAQEAKLDLICRKLRIRPGMRILDIGCGWGGTARYITEHHPVQVVGITVSKQQADHARQLCQGLPVEILYQDYRQVRGRFDRILSVGMFEHVGYKNYRGFMQTVRNLLDDDGLFLLHTIGSLTSQRVTDPWIGRYIFPNGMLPSVAQIARAAEDLLVMEDWHNFGADYDRTLMCWLDNFKSRWNEIRDLYDERFYRMWTYYLQVCAGSFRARKNQLWQIVFSPNGVPGGYHCEPGRH